MRAGSVGEVVCGLTIYLFIILVLAALALCCCPHPFSSCGEQRWLLLLPSTCSVVVAHGLSCSETRGIFPDQGWNLCPLHWKADSLPLDHLESPKICTV